MKVDSDPQLVLDELMKAEPVTVSNLPELTGLYMLLDHTGMPRSVGKSDSANHRSRCGKHVSGAIGCGHRFANAYNTISAFHEGPIKPRRRVRDLQDSEKLNRWSRI